MILNAIAEKLKRQSKDDFKGRHFETWLSEHDDFEPHHASSPTDHVLNELQLHGYRPFEDEPDQRLLPDGNTVAGAIADIFDALIGTLEDTRLEPDLDDLL
ncbi:hypothetical protein ACVMH6_002134 [Rhizobium leguminosarum]